MFSALTLATAPTPEKIDLIQRVREVESEANSPIAILADLQGPKLRIGHFVNRTIDLKQGQNFDLDQDATPGTNRRVSFMEPWAYANIQTNSLLELDDGRVTLRVVEANLYRIRTIVEFWRLAVQREGDLNPQPSQIPACA